MQPPISVDPGTRRLMRVVAFVVGMAGAVLAMAYAKGLYLQLSAPEFGGLSNRIDFSAYWAAARLGLAGEWAAAFDPQRLAAARALPPGDGERQLLWLYPPTFHLLVAPLGALGFFAAWAVFAGGSLAAFAAALLRVAWPVPGAWALAVMSPAALLVLAVGQNTLLLAALLLGALGAIERGRWAAAGLCFAAMTIKPQLGLLVPVALIAAGHWRVIGWASAGTAAMVAVTLVVPGPGYWVAMVEALARVSGLLAVGRFQEDLMIGWFTGLIHLGAARGPAMAVQSVVSVACILAITWIWAKPRAPHALKAAALCFCLPMTTPYAHFYEWLFPTLGAVYLTRDGYWATPWQRALILAIWGAPLVAFALRGPIGFPVCLPLMVLALGVTLARARR